MTIATKNGNIIVKDGSLAASCNCCTPPDPCGYLPNQVTVRLPALGFYQFRPECCPEVIDNLNTLLPADYVLERNAPGSSYGFLLSEPTRSIGISVGFDCNTGQMIAFTVNFGANDGAPPQFFFCRSGAFFSGGGASWFNIKTKLNGINQPFTPNVTFCGYNNFSGQVRFLVPEA